MSYTTRDGGKLTTISVRLGDNQLAALDRLVTMLDQRHGGPHTAIKRGEALRYALAVAEERGATDTVEPPIYWRCCD
jgi:hypothetical protein